jgi:hypothetical protein
MDDFPFLPREIISVIFAFTRPLDLLARALLRRVDKRALEEDEAWQAPTLMQLGFQEEIRERKMQLTFGIPTLKPTYIFEQRIELGFFYNPSFGRRSQYLMGLEFFCRAAAHPESTLEHPLPPLHTHFWIPVAGAFTERIDTIEGYMCIRLHLYAE